MTTRTANGTATEEVNIVEGTDENDGLVGTDGVDKIFGLAGDDTLSGGACDDEIYGGAGIDTFYGGAGNDTFYGDSRGNRPETDIFAYRKEEFGNDTIKDFNANPVSEGGDVLAFLGANVSLSDLEITENEHGHAVVKMGKMGTITLENVSQTDLLENIDDNIVGLVGAAGIIGTRDDDVLSGTDGNDQIYGLAGDDTLSGGAGDDHMYGGRGADTFAYDSKTFGNDEIKDFDVAEDKLDFTGSGLSFLDLEIGENEDGDVVLVRGNTGNSITLKGVSETALLENISNTIAGLAKVSGISYIFGTRNDDDLSGTAGDNLIFGLAGNDTVQGLAGDDFIYGGRGDDRLSGNAGKDTLHGGVGADTFAYATKTFGHDIVKDFKVGKDKLDFTGSGLSLLDLKIGENEDGDVVLVRGNAGNSITLKGVSETALLENISSTITGLAEVSGISYIFGTRNADDLSGTLGDNLIFGLAGNDTIQGLAGGDDIYGGRGDDTIHGGGDRDFIFGGAGEDTLDGGTGNDVLFGGAGNDTLKGGAGRDTFVYDDETFGNDTIKGFKVDEDRLDFTGSGLSFDDLKIKEESGDTVITVLKTGSTITLEGVTGVSKTDPSPWMVGPGFGPDDAIVGSWRDDRLMGTDKDDHIFGLGGDDVIHGKGGDDHLYGGDEGDVIFGGDGKDKLYGGGNPGPGFGAVDFLNGNAGDDELYGGVGSDFLTGGSGNDLLEGGAGNDVLFGGGGDDILQGDTGADIFEYEYGQFGNDTITDFEDGIDKLKFKYPGRPTFDNLMIENNDDGHAVVTKKGDPDWGSITLLNITAADLTSEDFLFA